MIRFVRVLCSLQIPVTTTLKVLYLSPLWPENYPISYPLLLLLFFAFFQGRHSLWHMCEGRATRRRKTGSLEAELNKQKTYSHKMIAHQQ